MLLQEEIKINIILLDNHGYQCIHGLQKSCGSQSFGNEFRHRNSKSQKLDGEVLSLDFVANAKSLGAETFTAKNKDELIAALELSQKTTKTCLIYIPLRTGTPVPGYSWWDVPISEESTESSVKAARKKYEEALSKRQFYY